MTETELIIALKMLKMNKRQITNFDTKADKEYEESISKFEERLRLIKELKNF
jgi:hypothetical protein